MNNSSCILDYEITTVQSEGPDKIEIKAQNNSDNEINNPSISFGFLWGAQIPDAITSDAGGVTILAGSAEWKTDKTYPDSTHVAFTATLNGSIAVGSSAVFTIDNIKLNDQPGNFQFIITESTVTSGNQKIVNCSNLLAQFDYTVTTDSVLKVNSTAALEIDVANLTCRNVLYISCGFKFGNSMDAFTKTDSGISCSVEPASSWVILKPIIDNGYIRFNAAPHGTSSDNIKINFSGIQVNACEGEAGFDIYEKTEAGITHRIALSLTKHAKDFSVVEDFRSDPVVADEPGFPISLYWKGVDEVNYFLTWDNHYPPINIDVTRYRQFPPNDPVAVKQLIDMGILKDDGKLHLAKTTTFTMQARKKFTDKTKVIIPVLQYTVAVNSMLVTISGPDTINIDYGAQAKLTYASTKNVNYCIIKPAISVSNQDNGTVYQPGDHLPPNCNIIFTPTQQDNEFFIKPYSQFNIDGMLSDPIKIYFNPVSFDHFTANPSRIYPGGNVVLDWLLRSAFSCSIDQGIGPVNSSGSRTVNVKQTTTFALTFEGIRTGQKDASPQNCIVTVVSIPEYLTGRTFRRTCKELIGWGDTMHWNDITQEVTFNSQTDITYNINIDKYDCNPRWIGRDSFNYRGNWNTADHTITMAASDGNVFRFIFTDYYKYSDLWIITEPCLVLQNPIPRISGVYGSQIITLA